MTPTQTLEQNNAASLANAVWQRIRFAAQAEAGQTVLMEFADPTPTKAIVVAKSPLSLGASQTDNSTGDLDILVVPGQPSDHPAGADGIMQWVMEKHTPGMPLPVTITLHGAQVVWLPNRAAVTTTPERVETLVLSLVEFCFYERELGLLERATAEAWPQLEADAVLAFAVTNNDLDRQPAVAKQMQRLVNIRMRHARIGPRLNRPSMHLATLANQLGERLRERSRVVERLETLAGQLEVFERLYEMSSHRFSEFRMSKHETTLEWLIIVILAAETVLILIDVLLNLGR